MRWTRGRKLIHNTTAAHHCRGYFFRAQTGKLEGRTHLAVLRTNVYQDLLSISVNLIHEPNLLASLVHILLININCIDIDERSQQVTPPCRSSSPPRTIFPLVKTYLWGEQRFLFLFLILLLHIVEILRLPSHKVTDFRSFKGPRSGSLANFN
jgi:hypothetical protein